MIPVASLLIRLVLIVLPGYFSFSILTSVTSPLPTNINIYTSNFQFIVMDFMKKAYESVVLSYPAKARTIDRRPKLLIGSVFGDIFFDI